MNSSVMKSRKSHGIGLLIYGGLGRAVCQSIGRCLSKSADGQRQFTHESITRMVLPLNDQARVVLMEREF